MIEKKKLFCKRPNIFRLTAVLFIVFALVFCLFDYIGYCKSCVKYASVFATLAGAILVFSTLEIQSQSLREEKSKNKITRFDSRFYPILSSFRTDAANVEIIRKYIVKKGREIGNESQMSFTGDKAFSIAHQIIDTLRRGIMEESFVPYNHEDVLIELSNIRDQEDALDEYNTSEEDLDKLDRERHDYIKSQQAPFLLYTYGIKKDVKERLCHFDPKRINSILLNKLLEQQPATFTKYIRTLRFIIYIIEKVVSISEKHDYYLSVYSQLEKNEIAFLKEFNEFDNVTMMCHEWEEIN